MVGTTGTHFVTHGYGGDLTGGDLPLNYLYSYNVASNGAIGKQVSAIDTQLYDGSSCTGAAGGQWPDGKELDHTGRYIYVPYCTDAVQTYRISNAGVMTFQNATIYNNPDQSYGGLPKITGNNTFAYNQTITTAGPHGPNGAFAAFARESDGTLQYIGIPAVTGPTFPTNYFSSFDGILTNDPTDHLAVMLGLRKFIPPDTVANEGCALASFTVGSKGQLTSTNTYANMPEVCGQSMLLSPSGKFLVVLSLGGRSLQLFHFNGSQPITNFTQITGKSGWFSAMAWDKSNHLYALNGLSGRLHVYTVTSSGVVEAAGSPYTLPFCGYDLQDNIPNCPQSLIVRSLPQ
jgi:WD40 repeat protein